VSCVRGPPRPRPHRTEPSMAGSRPSQARPEDRPTRMRVTDGRWTDPCRRDAGAGRAHLATSRRRKAGAASNIMADTTRPLIAPQLPVSAFFLVARSLRRRSSAGQPCERSPPSLRACTSASAGGLGRWSGEPSGGNASVPAISAAPRSRTPGTGAASRPATAAPRPPSPRPGRRPRQGHGGNRPSAMERRSRSRIPGRSPRCVG
jgi:hypothetical protein